MAAGGAGCAMCVQCSRGSTVAGCTQSYACIVLHSVSIRHIHNHGGYARNSDWSNGLAASCGVSNSSYIVVCDFHYMFVNSTTLHERLDDHNHAILFDV